MSRDPCPAGTFSPSIDSYSRLIGNTPPLFFASVVRSVALRFMYGAFGPSPFPPIPWQLAQLAMYSLLPRSTFGWACTAENASATLAPISTLITTRFILAPNPLQVGLHALQHRFHRSHRGRGHAPRSRAVDSRQLPAVAPTWSGPVSDVPLKPSSRCSGCGAEFSCGRADHAGCWCDRLPTLPPDRYAAAAGCLCEGCLRRMLDAANAESRLA